MQFTPSELMIVCSARALARERVVFVGVGLPNIACNLARRTLNWFTNPACSAPNRRGFPSPSAILH
jgi:acyl CoA:acetate/3-ketoacid CoA transferase beta subunit